MRRYILPMVALLWILIPALIFAQGTYQYDVSPEEAVAWGIGCWIAMMVFSLIWLAVWIIILIWVYKDAKARGMDNPAVWLILVIFTHFIGLIIYLVVRPKEKLPPGGGVSPPPTA